MYVCYQFKVKPDLIYPCNHIALKQIYFPYVQLLTLRKLESLHKKQRFKLYLNKIFLFFIGPSLLNCIDILPHRKDVFNILIIFKCATLMI